MTVRRNEPWGDNAPLPDRAPIAATDREVGRLVERAWADARPLPPVGLVGGDLCRALGGRRDAAQLREPTTLRAQIDVGELTIGERCFAFVAHVIVHTATYSYALAVMNSEFHRSLTVAPRAHPGDGMLDVVEARLAVQDRLKARRRLASGTHVPHPRIAQRRSRGETFALARPLRVSVDGERIGRARELAIRLHPAALTVHA